MSPGALRRARTSARASARPSGLRAGALSAALLAVSAAAGIGTAQAKATRPLSLDDAASKSSPPGKLTPRVLAELRSDPSSTKKILASHRLEWCDSTQAFRKSDPTTASRIMADAQTGVCTIMGPPDSPAVRNAAIPTATTPWKTIRVVFHLFANDDGSNPTSTAADAQGALDQLNMDYGPGRIRFVSTGVFTHRSTRFREPKDVDGEIVAMKRAYAQAPTRQINVYVFESKTANPQLLGRGTFTWSSDALGVQGGFFCDNDAFGLGKRTATHEFGHCLGLWHPFHGTEEVADDGCGGCRELAGRTAAQGDVTGDFCSDTPPTSRNFLCGPPQDNPQTEANEAVDECNGKPFGATDFRNYMGYADDDCISRFSAQQYGRMHAWVNYKLKGWIVGNGPTDPPVVESTTPSGRVILRTPGIGASFSQAMNRATVQAAFKITPAVRGTFVWAADSKSFTFRPSALLDTGTDYSVQILGSARNAANRPLDGNYNGRVDGATVDAVSWGFRTAGGPSNDMFARAQVLASPPSPRPLEGTVYGSNVEATKERGEPNHAYDRGGASVWYRYVAPRSGLVAVTTSGSNFDTVLAAYEGTSVATLTSLASNDDISNGDLASAIGFHAEPGKVYWIAVDGVRATSGAVAQGSIRLDWILNPAPSNDNFAAAQGIGGASGTATGNNSGAWSETGEPSHAYNTPNSSIWYRWTAPASGMATFNTEGSLFDTAIGVYTGPSVNALTSIASDEDSGSGTLSSVSFTAAAGTTYFIAINGSRTNQSALYNRGAAKLSWSMVVAPSNDLFAAAQVLGGNSGSVAGTNVGASTEAGEPYHNYSRNASVWYRFTAPASGLLVVTTQNSTIDTVLAAYTGGGVNSLTQIAQNDDVASGTKWSRVQLQAVAGQAYSIAVDSSSSSERGPIALNWMFYPAPANDMFANRQVLDGASGQVGGNNVGASGEPNEFAPYNYRGIASVWYQWTAPANGSVTFSTAGSNFDTVLAAGYQGTYGFETAASNDDAGGLKTSAITFDAVAGTTYFITLDSCDNYAETTRGDFVLSWQFSASGARLKAPGSKDEPSIRGAATERREPRRLALLQK